MKSKPNPFLSHSLALAASSAFLYMGSDRAAAYDWEGDTNSNFTEGGNWAGGSWAQWSDYTFGSAATTGAVTINDYFGIGSLSLQSGLTTDIVITSTVGQPVIMHTGIAGSATIAIASDSKNLTINGNYIAGSAVTWDVGASRTLTMNGPLNDWFATASLVKNGTGTAVLSGANGYNGTTRINAGTLLVTNSTGLGAGGHNGNTMTFINDGATLALQGGVSLDEHFHIYGSGVAGLGALHSISGNNALTNTNGGAAGYSIRSNTTVGVDADTLSVAGFYEESGSFNLTKIGSGTLALTTASSYTGATNVNAGILQVGTQNGLSDASAITVASGAELSMTAGSNNTLGINRVLTLNGGTLSAGGGAAQTNYGNFHLSPSGSISVGNDTGTSNITGNLSVDGRDLYNNIGGFSAITVGNNSTLTISGNVTGVSGVSWGGVSKYGNGTLKLTGTGDYAQGMHLAAGTVEFEENAMSLRNAGSPQQGYAADFAGNATLRWATGNTQDLSGNGGNDIYSASQIRIRDGVTATLDTNGNDVTLATAFSLGGSQTGALTKAGAGTLTLTATSNYTGGTTVNGGTLSLANGDWGTGQPFGGGGATGAITVGSGATLSTTAGVTEIKNGLTLNGGTVSSRGNTYGFGNGSWGNLLLSSNITAGNSLSSLISSEIRLNANRSIDVSNGSTLTISGGIAISPNYNGGIGNSGITKTGDGILSLSGANSYGGGTTVGGGKLVLKNTYGSSGFAISTGATLELNVDSDSRDLATTTFSGSGTLTKTGTGGVIWGVGSANFALGAGSLIDVQGGVFGGGSNGNEIWTNNLAGLNVAGGAIFNGVEANVRVDALTGAGIITSGYPGAAYENFTFGVNNGSGTFSGTLTDSDTAAANFVKAGSGTQTLTGTLDYNGTTTVSGGTLELPDGDWKTGGRYSGGVGASGTIIVGAGATLSTSSGVTGLQNGLVLNGGTVSSRGLLHSNYRNLLLESNITAGGNATSTISSEISLTGNREIAVGTNSTLNITGGIANDGFFGGSQGITKTGSGTLELTSTNNSYTGETVVTNGTLVVNGNISTSNMTTVQTGATVSGSGTVGSLTVNSGAFLNPGNSPGVLNVDGDFTQIGTLTMEINGMIAGTQHDQVNVNRVSGNGSVSLSGALVTAFSGNSYANGNLLFILLNDESDAITGTFSGLAQDSIVTNYGGFDWKISYTADSTGNTFTGGNDVALMAIPEPHAALLGSLALLCILRRKR